MWNPRKAFLSFFPILYEYDNMQRNSLQKNDLNWQCNIPLFSIKNRSVKRWRGVHIFGEFGISYLFRPPSTLSLNGRSFKKLSCQSYACVKFTTSAVKCSSLLTSYELGEGVERHLWVMEMPLFCMWRSRKCSFLSVGLEIAILLYMEILKMTFLCVEVLKMPFFCIGDQY